MFSLSIHRSTYRVLLVAGVLLAGSILVMTMLRSTFAQENGVIEYAENKTDPVATYTATDPEGAAVKWSLDGDDASDFMIDNGVLSFKKSPDYEKPMGGTASPPTSNTYTVMVKATDETRRVASETVMVNVTNVDEAGKVTLSARRPQTDTAFTAMVSDPDGSVTDVKWQWAKAGSKNGTYMDIDNATSTSLTYTPEDADSGSYLRATVTYEDGEGEGKSAMMVSEFPSQRITGGNDAPEFDDVQDPDGIDEAAKAIAKREVTENTDAGKTVGSPVVATDDNDDTLTYTLTDEDGGTDGDSASFGIDWGTGQILTKGDLDHEGKGTYTVVVRATDPSGDPQIMGAQTANSDTVKVTITVTDVNEAPAVTGEATATFDEGENGVITDALHTYMATDEDDGDDRPFTWSVGGADGSKFNIGNETDGTLGELKFKKKPNYEKPTDADTDNVYEVTVQASDGKKTGMRKVMVSVTNAEEAGVVTLTQVQPVVGIPVTAMLEDPDGGISKLTWEWSINGAATTSDGHIMGATSDTYKPKAGDVGGTLTATASYFDWQSAAAADVKKTAVEEADNPVALDTRNKAPVFGDEDPDTSGVQNSAATRSVEEKTTGNVGDAVNASDTKAGGLDERLQYRLTGTDAGKFEVLNDDLATPNMDEGGQITVKSATKLDYEGKRTYMVTVTATDPLGASSSIPVTIMVTNVDEAPDISGDDMIEYPEKGTNPVATYTASDPEGALVRWSLGGVDAEDFTIDNGVLRFAKTPNYESRKGGAGEPFTNTYVVNVQATDETRRMESETVTVEVTNVDEAGKVTLSARRPQSDTEFTAGVTDPDGGVVDVKWQWAKAGSKNGTYRDIDDATSEDYTPEDADATSYLRATATYEDDEGEGKTAMMVSEFPSQLITGGNDAPEFAAVQDPDGANDDAKAIAKRSVAENTDSGKTVGSPVVATDNNDDTLTYTLTDEDGGTDGDSASFGIDWGTGQILTKGDLDHEGKGTYTVVVRATDPSGDPQIMGAQTANSDTVKVTITVTDVNDAPVVAAGRDMPPTFDETDGDIATALETYTATDADGNTMTWSLGGADGSKFEIDLDDGALRFEKKPDYEKPTDADMDNVYEVTVQASDGKLTGMLKVKVTVNNENEVGTVTLDKITPVVGIPVTAELKDSDGGISKLRWAWVESPTRTTVSTSDTYTPKAGDVGNTLTVTATYFDGESDPSDITSNMNPQTASVTSVNVDRDTRNKAPVFGDEDPDTSGVQNSAATRKVEENTTGNVGALVVATDTKADGETEALQYSLSGADMSSFKVDNDGQIAVGSGTKLDYEGKRTYMVTVTATDPLGASSSIPVTIEVTNVDEAPEIMLGGLAITGMMSVEYAENGTGMVAMYSATGPDASMATWTVEGADAGDFTISSSGVLTFVSSPDYETKSTYMVTVKAADSTYTATHNVVVTVTDVEEVEVIGDTLLERYDTDDSGVSGEIDKSEVIMAINDYLFGVGDAAITKADVIVVINLYLFG